MYYKVSARVFSPFGLNSQDRYALPSRGFRDGDPTPRAGRYSSRPDDRKKKYDLQKVFQAGVPGKAYLDAWITPRKRLEEKNPTPWLLSRCRGYVIGTNFITK